MEVRKLRSAILAEQTDFPSQLFMRCPPWPLFACQRPWSLGSLNFHWLFARATSLPPCYVFQVGKCSLLRFYFPHDVHGQRCIRAHATRHRTHIRKYGDVMMKWVRLGVRVLTDILLASDCQLWRQPLWVTKTVMRIVCQVLIVDVMLFVCLFALLVLEFCETRSCHGILAWLDS